MDEAGATAPDPDLCGNIRLPSTDRKRLAPDRRVAAGGERI
jgi:hypothetical protein